MRELAGRRALLTGASRGLGPYLARALAREGVHLALTARSEGSLEAVAAEVRALGVRAVVLPADLTDAAGRSALVERAGAALGPLDLLVNNAGVEVVGPFAELDPETIDATVETNLLAALHLARCVLPGMIARGEGHVVSLGSLAGLRGTPYDAAYSATKAGLVAWTTALRGELDGTGVGASAVCPGYVREVGVFARFGLRAPVLPGSCRPEDVAEAVLRAVRRDLPQVVVNSFPMRPFFAFVALAPRLTERLFERFGILAFQKRKGEKYREMGLGEGEW